MSKNPEYISSWKDYRNRRRWWYIVWLGGTLLAILVSFTLKKLLQSDIPFYIVFFCFSGVKNEIGGGGGGPENSPFLFSFPPFPLLFVYF